MAKIARQTKVIHALIETGSVKQAAEVSGVSQPTIFRWLHEPDFKKEYQQARRRLLDITVAQLQGACGEAVQVLQSIMGDNGLPASPRVSAARTILDLAIKGSEIEELRSRIEAIEEKLLWQVS